MKKYLILGKLWFQKSYGNTYHSVKIIDLENGETVSVIPKTYGYGEQYRQTAYDKLVSLGLVDKKDRFNHELNFKRFVYQRLEVLRERDLDT